MSVTETERWLAPVLNYIPSQEQAARDAMPPLAPPNDVASHPPACTCALHLAWRKKAVVGLIVRGRRFSPRLRGESSRRCG